MLQTLSIPFRDIDGFRIYNLDSFNGSTFDLVAIFPDNSYRRHRHAGSHQEIYIISGCGKAIIGGKERDFAEGDYFFVPKDVTHCFYPLHETEMLSISTPPLAKTEDGIDVIFE